MFCVFRWCNVEPSVRGRTKTYECELGEAGDESMWAEEQTRFWCESQNDEKMKKKSFTFAAPLWHFCFLIFPIFFLFFRYFAVFLFSQHEKKERRQRWERLCVSFEMTGVKRWRVELCRNCNTINSMMRRWKSVSRGDEKFTQRSDTHPKELSSSQWGKMYLLYCLSIYVELEISVLQLFRDEEILFSFSRWSIDKRQRKTSH